MYSAETGVNFRFQSERERSCAYELLPLYTHFMEGH